MRARTRIIQGVSICGVDLGPLTAGATGAGVVLLEFAGVRSERAAAAIKGEPGSEDASKAAGHLDLLERELRAFAGGDRVRFVALIDWEGLGSVGTAFELQVWRALCDIPAGETRNYAEVAKAVGRPGADRAVGRANGRNRVAILIPCHRVIGADGRLTGYGGGMERKRALLEHEGAVEPAAGLFG